MSILRVQSQHAWVMFYLSQEWFNYVRDCTVYGLINLTNHWHGIEWCVLVSHRLSALVTLSIDISRIFFIEICYLSVTCL